jgi:hypothetical protein
MPREEQLGMSEDELMKEQMEEDRIIRECNFEMILNYLNELLQKDPDVFVRLFNQRVVCNEAFANADYVQVGAFQKGTNMFANGDFKADAVEYKVGFLGFLNGIVELLTGERVSVHCDLADDKSTFIRISRFDKWENNQKNEG